MNPEESNSIKNSNESDTPAPGSPASFPPPPPEDNPFSSAESAQTEKTEPEKEIPSESAHRMNAKDVMDYFKYHKQSLITYILLALGILCLIFDAFLLGSLLIGLIAGYHFSQEIVFYLRNLNKIFEGHEQTRYIVLTTILIAFFIAIPGIFIGAIFAGVFKYVLYENKE